MVINLKGHAVMVCAESKKPTCSLWNKNNGFSSFFGDYSEIDYKESVEEILTKPGLLHDQDAFFVKESQVHPLEGQKCNV